MQFEPVVLFSVSGFPVYAYGLSLSAAVLACGFLLAKTVPARGIKRGTVPVFLLYGLVLGLLGARLLYCLLRLDTYFFDADGVFRGLGAFFYLWEGGFAFYGAMGGVCLAAAAAARRTGQSAAALLDWAAPPAAVLVALARAAEILGGGWYGNIVESGALRFFPIAMYNDWMGEWNYSVFLLEAAAASLIAALLFRAWRKPRGKGDIALLFALYYASAQIVLERFRADDVLAWGFVLVAQVISAVLVVSVSALAGARALRAGCGRGRVFAEWGFTLAVLAWCGLVEYLLQKSDIENNFLYASRAVALIACAAVTAAALRKGARKGA